MTLEQVFKWFCKKNNVLPHIMVAYYAYVPRETIVDVNGRYVKFLNYGEFINRTYRRYGLEYLLYYSVMHFSFGYPIKLYTELLDMTTLPSFKGALRKWKYFCSNNIFLKESSLKIGDDVTVIGAPFTIWKVEKINLLSNSVSIIETNNNQKACVSLSSIKKDGKDIVLDFYVKRERKFYGIDK